MFGAALARTLTDRGRKVLVVEKRDHLGGMCHSENVNGVIVHKYGPHVFHTNDQKTWDWVNRFATFEPFVVRTKAIAKGKLWSFPINLMTLYQLWDVRTPKEAEEKLKSERLEINDPKNLEDWVLSTYGREIYETFYVGYTKKQWGRDPRRLPAAIAQRLPNKLTFDDNYFLDRYQGIPEGGYAAFFEKLLDGIEVRTGVDFFSDRASLEDMGPVVYSGRIDEYFSYCLGELEFRSCDFVTIGSNGDYQGNAVINYCDLNVPFTRMVEHKHFMRHAPEITYVTREYPMECGRMDTPLYPINDDKNMALYKEYLKLKPKTDVTFAGRLGSYRYLDMCEVIAQAFKIADKLC